MRSRTTEDLFRYWNGVRGDRPFPRRDEIQPADIRSLLPNIIILQEQADGGVNFRLAGTGVCGLFGHELRHHQFGALWLGEERREATRIARQVMAQCAPALITASGVTGTGDRLDVEILLAPLASQDGKGDRVLGALSPLSRPLWLHMKPLAHLSFGTLRVLDTEAYLSRETLATAGAPPARIGTYDRSTGKAPHLRVLEGGRRN